MIFRRYFPCMPKVVKYYLELIEFVIIELHSLQILLELRGQFERIFVMRILLHLIQRLLA